VAIWKNGHRVQRSQEARASAAPRWEGGLISDFDAGVIQAQRGAGWTPTTDRIAGGHSDVVLAPSPGGSDRSRGALRIEGTVASGATWPWSGALYSPGHATMQPVDASALRELVVQVRGDGREYAVLLFSGGAGGLPAMQSFVATPEWRELRFALADFRGVDLAQLRAIGFTAGLPAGGFALELDAVAVE
jgi:hypothetical protein